MNSLLEATAELADDGWRVFPVGRHKRPLTEHGLKTPRKTSTRSLGSGWAQTSPFVRVTGSPTRTVKTQNGGCNFAVSPKLTIHNSAGKLDAGIEGGNGGYVGLYLRARHRAGVLPYCRQHNIATLTYGALCRGLLSGRMSAG